MAGHPTATGQARGVTSRGGPRKEVVSRNGRSARHPGRREDPTVRVVRRGRETTTRPTRLIRTIQLRASANQPGMSDRARLLLARTARNARTRQTCSQLCVAVTWTPSPTSSGMASKTACNDDRPVFAPRRSSLRRATTRLTSSTAEKPSRARDCGTPTTTPWTATARQTCTAAKRPCAHNRPGITDRTYGFADSPSSRSRPEQMGATPDLIPLTRGSCGRRYLPSRCDRRR